MRLTLHTDYALRVLMHLGRLRPGELASIREVADAHRGESVLVVSHGGAICTAVPVLAANLDLAHAHGLPLPNCAVVALEADADGFVARSWDGDPL